MIASLSPNFEMALFIAQSTGSIILTDSRIRWEELKKSRHKVQGKVYYPFKDFLNYISSLSYVFSVDPIDNLKTRGGEKSIIFRKDFSQIYSNLKENQSKLDSETEERLKRT